MLHVEDGGTLKHSPGLRVPDKGRRRSGTGLVVI